MPAENVAPGRVRASLPIYAMLGATALSQVGNMLTFVAVPWFVLQTTGSAARTGIAGGAVALAAVLASLFGGPVVDRLGFKRTSVVSDLASGLRLPPYRCSTSRSGWSSGSCWRCSFLARFWTRPE